MKLRSGSISMENKVYGDMAHHDDVDQIYGEQEITSDNQLASSNPMVAYSKTLCKEEKKANAQVTVLKGNDRR